MFVPYLTRSLTVCHATLFLSCPARPPFLKTGRRSPSHTAVRSMPDLVMVPVLSKTMVEIFPATGILQRSNSIKIVANFSWKIQDKVGKIR